MMKFWPIIFVLAAGFVGGFFCGRYTVDAPDIVEHRDTIIIRDTFSVEKPVIEERRIIKKVPYAVTDTVMLHDTAYIYLDRESITYRDSLVKIVASGIDPSIDSITHFVCNKIVTITETVKVKEKPRWSIGLTAGYGAGKAGLTPFVGAGITYNLFSF